MPRRPSAPRPSTSGPLTGPTPPFPLRVSGKVISGFGRGSKELGIPTANIPVAGLSVGGHDDVESGVYFGWAGLVSKPDTDGAEASEKLDGSAVDGKGAEDLSGHGQVYPMVMSIGWNPFYKNTVRSVEVHLLHDFTSDFYGSHLNLLILGFIRPEYDYVDRDSLIEDIRTDIEVSRRSLERDAWATWKTDEGLLSPPSAKAGRNLDGDGEGKKVAAGDVVV
ncbi:MAG: riboflavin kinase [Sclerophora amabilis]|nr:MAG: riboflavin kinase [Sclerophora amabilis]